MLQICPARIVYSPVQALALAKRRGKDAQHRYTNDAGECLVMQARIGERPVNMVLMNSFGKLTRTADARRVRKWMEAQREPTVASIGTK